MGGRSAAAHRARRHHAVHHAGLSSSASAQSGFELFVEVALFVSAHVADRNKSKPPIVPARRVKPLHSPPERGCVIGFPSTPHKKIDDVIVPPIDNRGHRL